MIASIFFTERLPGTSIFQTAFVSTLRVIAQLRLSCTPARCCSVALRYAFQVDFPKSRVHAKLLRSLILECYQTIKVLLA